MRYIIKTKEPPVLLNFKSKYKKKYNSNAVFKDITYDDVKEELKLILLEEQYHICCYCMRRIKKHNSHVEHIRPQAKFPKETLDYNNLLVSCNGSDNCGHRKGVWYNEKEFISPLNSDCENKFTYNITGEMNSSDKNATITIAKLNLNSYLLTQARKAAIYSSGLFDNDFEQKKHEIVAYNSNPNTNNELPPFCMAVVYCVTNY